MNALIVNLKPFVTTIDDFFTLCGSNRDLRMERIASGDIIFMPPTGGITGIQNAAITGQLGYWNHQTQLGVAFDSSTGFHLPNDAVRSPDSSWIPQACWDALTQAEKDRFAPICPDFVIELRSSTDRLEPVQEKMHEYIANGSQLGWLIDPQERRVEVYRAGQPVEILDDPQTVSGEPLLPGFELKLERIFV